MDSCLSRCPSNPRSQHSFNLQSLHPYPDQLPPPNPYPPVFFHLALRSSSTFYFSLPSTHSSLPPPLPLIFLHLSLQNFSTSHSNLPLPLISFILHLSLQSSSIFQFNFPPPFPPFLLPPPIGLLHSISRVLHQRKSFELVSISRWLLMLTFGSRDEAPGE